MTLRLPFTSVPFSQLLVHWYQKLTLALFALVILYTLIGVIYYGTRYLFRRIRALRKQTSNTTQLGTFERELNTLFKRRAVKQCSRAKSFGVYLGSLDVLINEAQAELTSSWDLVVLNPNDIEIGQSDSPTSQTIKRSLSSNRKQSHLARLRLNNANATALEQDPDTQSYKLEDYANLLHGVQALESYSEFWHGIVLADCSQTPVKIVNSLISLCQAKQLTVFLEFEAPLFVGDHNILIDFDNLDGILLRNGSLLANGRRRDYFGMAPIRKVLKIAGRQLCLKKDFSLLAYEVGQLRCSTLVSQKLISYRLSTQDKQFPILS